MFNSKDHKIFLSILRESSSLRKKKNMDYGDSYKRMGSFGILCRMHDKMERLINLQKQKANVNESKEDTAKDLLNYSAMYVLMLREEMNGKHNK